MIQDLLTNKKYLFASGANTELRAQRNLNRRAVLLNVRTEQFGVSARVYENGVYGFSSTAEYTDETVKDVLKAASENAAFLAKHAGKGKGLHKAMAPNRIVTAYDLNDLEQRTYIEFAQALDNYIASKYPDLVSRTVVITCDSMEKLLCVSNGCDGHSIMPRSYIYVMMTAMGADGKPVELTAKEYDLIELLMRNPNRVYSREALLDTIWAYEYRSDIRTVDVHIRRLREKLEANPADPQYIMTKWGVGYYFRK